MLYHAGPSSLVFFAECLIITDSDLQIQNYKNEVQLKLKLHQLRRTALWLSKLQLSVSLIMVWVFWLECSLTGACSFSLGNSFLKLNSLWTVLLLPLCDQPGLRTTENNFALSFFRFLLVLLSLFTDPNSCSRKSKLFKFSVPLSLTL